MDYNEADNLLQGRNRLRRKLCNNTYLKRRTRTILEGQVTETISIGLELHGHEIMTFLPNGDTRLDSCGWQTVTTRDRLNRYLPKPFRIYQKHWDWYLARVEPPTYSDGPRWVFFNGITINDVGEVNSEPIQPPLTRRGNRR